MIYTDNVEDLRRQDWKLETLNLLVGFDKPAKEVSTSAPHFDVGIPKASFVQECGLHESLTYFDS